MSESGELAASPVGGKNFSELAFCFGADANSEEMDFCGMRQSRLQGAEVVCDLVCRDLGAAIGALLEIEV
jgi:hypothetical protein